jgi:hypothetical protein
MQVKGLECATFNTHQWDPRHLNNFIFNFNCSVAAKEMEVFSLFNFGPDAPSLVLRIDTVFFVTKNINYNNYH